MGKFIYGESVRVAFSDRLLQHLEFVITTKLRRGERFLFSWQDDSSIGGGRTTVWLGPGCSFACKYSDTRRAPMNRAWLDELMRLAASPSGLHPTAEPGGPH